MIKHLSFRQRQTLAFLALAVIFLGATLGAILPYSRALVVRRTAAQLDIVADLKTAEIHHWLHVGEEVALLISGPQWVEDHLSDLSAIQDEVNSQTAYAHLYAELEAMVGIHSYVRAISLLHPVSGQVVLSSDLTLEGREWENTDYFQEGRQALYVSPVAYSIGREAPVLTIGAPVQSTDGELLVVIAAEMDLADLEDTLSSRAGLGQTGRVYLVDAYGYYITVPPGVPTGPLGAKAESEGARRALEGQDGNATYLDPQGTRVLGAYRWVPEASVGLLVEIDEAELTAEITRIWTAVVLVGLGLLLLAAIVARYLANWLVTPLERIAAAARTLRAGDLGHRAPSGGASEIGQLAVAFNEMAESLQQSHENLEGLVKQRMAELQTANETLEQQARELTRSNAELEQFAYVISHDLREPLRVIANCLEFLEQRYTGRFDAKADKFIGYAVDGATRMDALIKGLLEYSRVDRLGRDFEPVDCKDILNDTLANLWMAMEESGATVTHDPLPVVSADPLQLGQVFQNLIGNAIKFRSEEPPRVHVSAERDGKEWVLSVRDNGIGVDPEQAERIFRVFQRLHTREEYPGIGIGLAICKKIVERHGGRIWAEAEPGNGTTFCFTLPDRA